MNFYILKCSKSARGFEDWRLNGVSHREGGPAHISHNWFKAWRIKGKLHRLNMPALKYFDGREYYYEYGILLSGK